MALKTLEELNRDFMAGSRAVEHDTKYEPITPLTIEVEPPRKRKPPGTVRREPEASEIRKEQVRQKPPGKKRGLFTAISDMLFSLAIVMILFVVLIPGSDGGEPRMIFNYAYFTVLTPSMQDEIPQGSFILVKRVNPSELKTGDNITYMADQSTSVTHKIVDIFENYENSGARGFRTQGVNNANPDPDIVYESYVVGKVIFVLPVAGAILSNLSENVFLVFIIFGLCVLFAFLLRGIFSRSAKRSALRTT